VWIYNLDSPTRLRGIIINQRDIFSFTSLQVFMVHGLVDF
jgi:hypothetical protein